MVAEWANRSINHKVEYSKIEGSNLVLPFLMFNLLVIITGSVCTGKTLLSVIVDLNPTKVETKMVFA